MTKDQEAAVHPFFLKLNTLAARQPGYLSGETLIGYHNTDEYLTISVWRSILDWENFQQLAESKDLHYTIDQIIVRPTEHHIYSVVEHKV